MLKSLVIRTTEGAVDGRREQPRTVKHRQPRDRDAGSGDPRGLVRVADYPSLELLCWNIEAPCITRKNAFALYERCWRLVNLAGAPEHERALIDDLAREFGRGLINA